MFAADAFDTKTLSVLNRAFDEAWTDVQAALCVKPLDPELLKTRLARRIVEAADRGERDPKRLRLIALGAIGAND